MTGQERAPTETSLSRLLDTEAGLDALLADARAKADALVRDAETRAQARLAALDAELADLADVARRRAEGEAAEHVARVERASRLALSRFRAVDDDRAAALAAWVVERVLADLAPPAAS